MYTDKLYYDISIYEQLTNEVKRTWQLVPMMERLKKYLSWRYKMSER